MPIATRFGRRTCSTGGCSTDGCASPIRFARRVDPRTGGKDGGGSTALELARSGAPLGAVTSFRGGLSSPKPEDAVNIKARVLVCHGDLWDESLTVLPLPHSGVVALSPSIARRRSHWLGR